MATAVIPGSQRPVLVRHKPRVLPSLSQGKAVSNGRDLTIHRITATHHGRTLLILGHAAEHLAASRMYSVGRVEQASNVEAIHILMRLSREVFEEFAERRSLNRRFQDWTVERAVRLLEGAGRLIIREGVR